MTAILNPPFPSWRKWSANGISMIVDIAMDKSATLTVDAPVNLDLESYIASYRGQC